MHSALTAQVVCGGEHSMVITEGGKVYSWGRGNMGQTGQGHTETTNTPQLVQALQHLHVTQVGSTLLHCLVHCHYDFGMSVHSEQCRRTY